MAEELPLPQSVAGLPIGATFTHKGVEYRKVLNRYDRKDVVHIVELMAKIHPEHPNLSTVGGSLAGVKALSVCAECPASSDNLPEPYRGCTEAYVHGKVPCRTADRSNGTLIVTVDTAYELALAGCVSW